MFIINLYFSLFIPLTFIGGFAGISYVLTHPDKFERLISMVLAVLRLISRKAEEAYVKYSIQAKINGFIKNVKKDVPNLTIESISMRWVPEDITEDQFLKSGQLVLCMHRSRNNNRNLVNATVAFVSFSLLQKAKNYIAKYQKEAINLFATTQILQKDHPEAVSEFVDCYLSEAMDNKKINDLYGKFDDVHKTGLFFPVFINEMNFLGEKVFGHKKRNEVIYEEVNSLTNFLYRYSQRKLNEETNSEFDGNHCKFAIRIVGKSMKIENEGPKVYIDNIQKAVKIYETIYLIGDQNNKGFIDNIVEAVLLSSDYRKYNEKKYNSVIKDRNGDDYKCKSYIVTLRTKNTKVYYKE